MADITSESVAGRRTKAQDPAGSQAEDGRLQIDPELISCVELFYFAYRDFTRDPDTMLEQYGFGRAHHRVLHFIHRNPGLKVAELLDILKITKQSLARVLKQLVDEGFVIQRAGSEDRRERRLYLSAKGVRLTDKLTQIQVKRVAEALATLGPGADQLARNFLFAMITEKDRPQVEILIKGQHAEIAGGSESSE
ncbi:MAG TPA: MarR family transcriptional regulator [Hyphomicrobium sp.]|jgi:DNA-binding MarR family transcriptional regulator|nr:MarR family transcriptional regulator [Hyphomicrobium sp.]